MKYTLYLNQVILREFGIRNINQGHILDLLTTVSTWAEPIIIDKDVFYWVARQRIVDDLWILNLKTDTVYRHLKKLAELGVINYKKQGKKDCIRLTKKGKEYLSASYVGNESERGANSDLNPTKLGNESENNSDLNPTYTTTSSNTTTKDKSVTTVTTSSDEIPREIAGYLADKIIENKPNFIVKNFEAWVRDIDRAMRIDKRTYTELIECIDWIYTYGDFWIPNILSGKKLREKFDTLQAQMMSKPSNNKQVRSKQDEILDGLFPDESSCYTDVEVIS